MKTRNNTFTPMTRRGMLQQTAAGFGWLAFAAVNAERALAAGPDTSPLAPKPPQFPARAKRVIFLRTGSKDAHSGVTGGAARNPLAELMEVAQACVDAKTGQVHYDAERFEGISGVYASPVGAAGRVYVVGHDGNAVVIKQGPKPEILARNKLDDKIDASPVVVGKQLFLRGHEHLYCLSTAN